MLPDLVMQFAREPPPLFLFRLRELAPQRGTIPLDAVALRRGLRALALRDVVVDNGDERAPFAADARRVHPVPAPVLLRPVLEVDRVAVAGASGVPVDPLLFDQPMARRVPISRTRLPISARTPSIRFCARFASRMMASTAFPWRSNWMSSRLNPSLIESKIARYFASLSLSAESTRARSSASRVREMMIAAARVNTAAAS